jgi:chromosome partitioning protein
VIYTVAQEKGGVGKTTTAINVAAALARRGRNVLAIDADPRFALTRQLGLTTANLAVSLVEVLAGQVDARAAIVAEVHGIDVLPTTRRLDGVEMSLVTEVGRETFLRDALDSVAGDYDDIVIDTPPNLGMLTVNALMIADVVLAPISVEDEGSAQGVAELRATLTKLERLRGTQPELVVLLTRYQAGRVMTDTVERTIESLGFEPAARIPARTIVHQAGVERVPLVLSAPTSSPAVAYIDLADSLIETREALAR